MNLAFINKNKKTILATESTNSITQSTRTGNQSWLQNQLIQLPNSQELEINLTYRIN